MSQSEVKKWLVNMCSEAKATIGTIVSCYTGQPHTLVDF